MNGHRITGLPTIPLSSSELITKGFVERYSDYKNILTFKGKPGAVTILHTDTMVDTPANGRSNKTLDCSKVGDSYQINFDVTPKLPNGIYSYEMDIVLTMSRGYNIMLWGDCGGSGYNASMKYKYWSWSLTNKIAQNDAQGGYFHRGTGKRMRIKGYVFKSRYAYLWPRNFAFVRLRRRKNVRVCHARFVVKKFRPRSWQLHLFRVRT